VVSSHSFSAPRQVLIEETGCAMPRLFVPCGCNRNSRLRCCCKGHHWNMQRLRCAQQSEHRCAGEVRLAVAGQAGAPVAVRPARLPAGRANFGTFGIVIVAVAQVYGVYEHDDVVRGVRRRRAPRRRQVAVGRRRAGPRSPRGHRGGIGAGAAAPLGGATARRSGSRGADQAALAALHS